MKKIFTSLIIFGFVGLNQIYCQQIQPINSSPNSIYLKPNSKEGWIEFRQDNSFSGETIFIQLPELLGLRKVDELRLYKSNIDPAGNKHYKYIQYYNNVRVEGVEEYAHERSGHLHLINGDFIQGLNVNTVPAISPDRSIQVALEKFPAKRYTWENETAERDFKQKKNNPNATLYPEPELLIIKKDPHSNDKLDNYVLAYRMYIFADDPYISEYVYVDAHSGEYLRSRSLDIQCNATTISTTYNGDQTVYTKYTTDECGYHHDLSTGYFSWDDCNPDTEIKSYTSGPYGGLYYGDDWYECDNDNSWPETGSETMTLTTLWAVKKAYLYFLNTYGHESFDGSDGLIDAFNGRTYFDSDGDAYCTNANYTNVIDNLNFGAGNDCINGTTDDYNPLDIVGHEYTHGIIEYAHYDALDYSEESGALNESFADIFGEMVEHYIEGGSMTWLHGEDMSTGPNRSFSNPDSLGYPDTYFGSHWASLDGDDNGGVHTNSSVQNHMFYLLSEGGSGTNDHGIEYYVEGIGWDHARQIAWQAMMQYLDGSDGYITARNAWIQSAIDLYGSCSQEVISVGQAWQAAGVTDYTIYDVASICGTYAVTGYADATYGIENSTLIVGEFLLDCTTTILSTASVTLESGYYIQLNPGFTAQSGCTFTAWIDKCEVSDYDSGDLRSADAHTEENTISEKKSSYILYPVPADEYVSFEFDLTQLTDIQIELFDLSGRRIESNSESYTAENSYQVLQVNTADLPSGIYVAIIRMNEQIGSEKIIIQH